MTHQTHSTQAPSVPTENACATEIEVTKDMNALRADVRKHLSDTVTEAGKTFDPEMLEQATENTVKGIMDMVTPREVARIRTTEAYKSNVAGNPMVVIVHERKDGDVFFHQQKWDDKFVLFTQFKRLDEATFDAAIAAQGVRFDADELPAFKDGAE